ncbi:MAG: FMN-binding negative transcriptional regulator [Planctomycetota bacterium]
MYIPPSFLETDVEKLHDFMEQHSFATLISTQADEPFASHLPLLINRDSGPCGSLIGHMARANSQWQSAAGQQILAIFHGPHAYISPGWMETQNVVPTWNYVAVHAYGVLRLIEDHDQLRQIVTRTVDHYESSRERPWSLESPDTSFIEKLLGAIVGFEIVVDQLEGKWKLNQNHPVERREQIIQGLRDTGMTDELQIADLMDLADHPPTK